MCKNCDVVLLNQQNYYPSWKINLQAYYCIIVLLATVLSNYKISGDSGNAGKLTR